MAVIRNNKKPIEGLDRAPVKSNLIKLKPGDENRLAFPKRDNQFYQVGIAATYRNKFTKKRLIFGLDKGRNAIGDYMFSRKRQIMNFESMLHEAIGFGYNRCEVNSYIPHGDSDSELHEGNPWELEKVNNVYVLILRNVRTKKDGSPRKVKPVVLVEKKSWKKAQMKAKAKKMAENKKKSKKPAKKVRKTLPQLIAAKKKAKTTAEREKLRKAIWNKQHPRKR